MALITLNTGTETTIKDFPATAAKKPGKLVPSPWPPEACLTEATTEVRKREEA